MERTTGIILLYQDRAEAIAASKRKIVHAQVDHRREREIGQLHDPMQDGVARGLHPKARCQSGASLAIGGQPDRLQSLTKPDSHPSPRLHKLRHALGKHFPFTEGIVTVKSLHREGKPYLLFCTGNITQGPLVVAVDRR